MSLPLDFHPAAPKGWKRHPFGIPGERIVTVRVLIVPVFPFLTFLIPSDRLVRQIFAAVCDDPVRLQPFQIPVAAPGAAEQAARALAAAVIEV